MPALFLLRLADRNIPAMDQLYFYVRKMDTMIEHMKDMIEILEEEIKSAIDTTPKVINYRTIVKGYLMNSRTVSSTSSLANKITLLGQADIAADGDESDDDSDNDSIADDLPDDDEVPTVLEPTQGMAVMASWEKRSKLLRHDVAITAWVCSPIDAVMKDAMENIKAIHIDAVNRVIKKWFITEKHSVDDAAKIGNTFWDERFKFHTKTDMFANMEHSGFHKSQKDLASGKSYFWHQKESIPRTEVFGKVAARVCCKILGIGSAERSWGDVKHLKSNKRSHLSSDKVKKQATLFGQSSMDMARYKEINASGDLLADYWMDDDLEVVTNLLQGGPEVVTNSVDTQPPRVFKAWIEPLDNERRFIFTDEARDGILDKYGGLKWLDDSGRLLNIDRVKMRFKRITNNVNKNHGGGWFFVAYDDQLYSPGLPYEDNLDNGGIEEVPLTYDLVDGIADYYTRNPDMGVTVEKRLPPLVERYSNALHDNEIEDEGDDVVIMNANTLLGPLDEMD